MDAINQGWQTLRVILFGQPAVPSLLVLFYLVGLLVAGSSSAREIWFGLAVLFVFPTAGFLGIATERITLLCQSAGALAIPGHARNAKRFQLALLILLIGVPVVASAAAGESALPVATILCGGAALGILFVSRPYLLVAVIVPAVALRGLALGDWLANGLVQAGLLAVELYVIARWFRLSTMAEAAGATRVLALAGVGHEDTSEAMADTFGIKPADVESYERALDHAVEKHRYREGRSLSSSDLGFALSFDPKVRLKPMLVGTGAGCLAVLAWNFFHGQQPEGLAYWFVAVFAAMAPLNRASTLYGAWRASSGEQALLSLAPKWPTSDGLRSPIARAIANCVPGAWVVWSGATVLALGLRAVSFEHAVTAAAVLLAVSTATVTNLLLLLSRAAVHTWHPSTFLSLGIPALGALAIALRPIGGPATVGLALIVAPVLVAALVFRRRRLTFPVNVIR
jgi:hypothetical protein